MPCTTPIAPLLHTMGAPHGDGPLEFCHTFFSTWFFEGVPTSYFRLCERQVDAPFDTRQHMGRNLRAMGWTPPGSLWCSGIPFFLISTGVFSVCVRDPRMRPWCLYLHWPLTPVSPYSPPRLSSFLTRNRYVSISLLYKEISKWRWVPIEFFTILALHVKGHPRSIHTCRDRYL